MKNFEFFHGAAMIKIIHSGYFKTVQNFGKSNSCYLVDEKIGVYIKHTQKRISPWPFTFEEEHVKELDELNELLGNAFIVLVCNDDGVCCLNWKEFCTIISVDSNNYPKWVKATRRKNEKYSVSGSDGELKYKIGNIDFPDKLKNHEHAD